MMNELNRTDKNELRNKIAGGYNLQEMKLLCQNLDVNWEDVGGTEITRSMFAHEIVEYFERRGRLYDLIQRVKADRPNLFDEPDSWAIEDTYNNEQSTYVNTENSKNNTVIWVGLFIIVIVALFVWNSQNSQQKQKEPEHFVTAYINELDSKSFSRSWEKLSGDYRISNHPTGFTPYIQYYQSFKNIEILKLEVLEETDTTASVRVFLALTNLDNTVINQDILFKLARSSVDDTWLIKESSP